MAAASSPSTIRHIFSDLAKKLQRNSGEHLYCQIRSLIRSRIADGSLHAGLVLPPQRELCRMIDASEVTVRRALQELADEGLIQAVPGRGTLVLSRAVGASNDEKRPASAATLTIGIAFASLTDGYPFFRPLLQGIREQTDQNVNLRLFDLPAAPGDAETPFDLNGLDGIIMMSPVNLQLVATCHRRRLPCVLLYSDIADGYSHCLLVDYTMGVLDAVAHLKRRGKQRIALVTAEDERFSTGQINDAYRLALHVHTMPANAAWLLNAGYHEEDGHRAMQALMALPEPPDAVIFASDYQARGALLAAHAAGLSVPADVAVVGAGRVLGDSGWPVPLTTIDLHFEEVGRIAASTIESLRRGEHVPHRQTVRTSLVIGQTA